MKRKSLQRAVTAVMLLVIAVTVLSLACPRQPALYLENPDTGGIYGCFPMAEGDTFSISFVHSINRTPYYDLYEIRDGAIWMTGLLYYSFGAGVPEDLDPAWTLELLEDGGMLVTGMDTRIPTIIYRVGTIFDHFLTLPDGTRVNLTQLCGRSSRVQLLYR